MAELVRTNDPGIIAVIEGLLGSAALAQEARELLIDAELGNWLRS